MPATRGRGHLLGPAGWVALACVGCCAAPFVTPFIAGSTLATMWAADLSVATILVAVGVLAFGAVIINKSSASHEAGAPTVCRLPLEERAQRTSEFRELFASREVARERSLHGVRWTFAADAGSEAESVRLAALEERCCDGIKIRIHREGEAVVWDITGPPTASSLLDTFYELPALITSDAGAEQLWSTLDAAACGPTKP